MWTLLHEAYHPNIDCYLSSKGRQFGSKQYIPFHTEQTIREHKSAQKSVLAWDSSAVDKKQTKKMNIMCQ